MSPNASLNQAGMANSGLRKRNVHIQEDEAADQQDESLFLQSFFPKALQECIAGEESDRTQNVLATPEKIQSRKGPIHMSCKDHDQQSNQDLKMKMKDPFVDVTEEVPDLDLSRNAATTVSSMVSSSSDSSNLDSEYDYDGSAFLTFRLSYLFVTLVVMLADGLQGTHLYVLYEGYGFSVASLYCLGFITGAVTAPITGPLIDRFGRKKSALLYCALEVGINMLEQFPFLSGLIVSRVVGGVTTNLLSTVFETWLDTEYRNRGFAEEEYETLMRDSVVVSNLAAIASGYLAHVLAESFGNTGPFQGAVTCTAVAFAVVFFLWNENYGKLGQQNEEGEESKSTSPIAQLKETLTFIRSDSKVMRVCITQGLTLGSLHIFIFLWSPLLKEFAAGCKGPLLGLDSQGEPAYGLIFGAYMAAGVLGGLLSPALRKVITFLLSPLTKGQVPETVTVDDDEEPVRAMDIEFQGALCYFTCALLLLAPSLLPATAEYTFSIALFSFIAYEFSVGIYSPCEGMMRSIYIPPESRGSIMTVPSIIVNVAVALAVVSTESISNQTALCVISVMMMTCGFLQLSMVSKKEWASLFGRIDRAKRASISSLRSISSIADDLSFASLQLKKTTKVE